MKARPVVFRPRGCRRPKRHPEATHGLAESVRQAVGESGAQLVDLAILEPAGLAFAITLKTDEPRRS
jgi:hypothetical protein